MEYTGTDFTALVDAIEDDGGVHLDELCEPTYHKIRSRPGGKLINRKGTGCDDATMFKIKYKAAIFGGDPENDQLIDHNGVKIAVPVDEGVHLLRVCANDDDLGKWPRFAHALNPDWENDG